jgi:hypothetical protein
MDGRARTGYSLAPKLWTHTAIALKILIEEVRIVITNIPGYFINAETCFFEENLRSFDLKIYKVHFYIFCCAFVIVRHILFDLPL